MRMTCPRDGLLTACRLVGVAAAPKTTPKPILSAIKCLADGEELTLTATDQELGIRYTMLGIRIEEGGEAIFPIAKLTSILQEAVDDLITIEADMERVRVLTTSSEFEMPTENPADFPEFPAFDGQKSHHMKAGELRTLIRRTVFAAAKEATRYGIPGVLWEVDAAGTVRLVATDGRRLAIATAEAEVPKDGEAKGMTHLVPTKALLLLERNLADDGELIQIVLNANEVQFRTERAVIWSRLLEGRFPPYRDIMPKKDRVTAKARLSVAGFLAAVRQAAIMVDEETKRVLCIFNTDKVILETKGPKTGRSKVELRLEEYTGPTLTVHFDPQFLVEMLKVLDDESELNMEMESGQKPVLFRAGDSYIYLVMPLT